MASNKPKGKRYKCPYCEYRGYRSELIEHVEDKHEDMIPKDYSPARVVYNAINKKEHGSCMICHKETNWDENKQRYDTLCGSKKCKDEYVKIVRSRMVKKYGTDNLLKDPNFQKKMLENRSISGKYKFEDGGSVGYVGSYEKKFLEFMDQFLHIKSYDIISPGPTIPYNYNGKKHAWITDFIYEPYNLVFDIKDGGDNPNTREMNEYREKQTAKEKAIAEYGDYNYIRLTDNKFEQLITIFMELKEKADDKPIIRINESFLMEDDNSAIFENYLISKDDIYLNFDLWKKNTPHNILWVTGISGSGKSTISKDLAKKYNAEYIELDMFTNLLVKGNDTWLAGIDSGKYTPHDLIRKYYELNSNLPVIGSWDVDDIMSNEHDKLLVWLVDKIKNTNKLYIIDGAQLFMNTSETCVKLIKDEPLIIKGTSALVSHIRRVKRDLSNKSDIKGYLHTLKKDIPLLFKYYFSNEKLLQDFIKNVNESFLIENNKEDFIDSLTAYHLEPKIGNKGPHLRGWDEELYSKNINYAVLNDIKSNYNVKDQTTVKAYVYTAGKNLKPIYLGTILIPDKNNHEVWEWEKKETLSNEDYNYLVQNPMESCIIEEGTKSSLDSNYKPKGKKSLSSFKRVHITEAVIDKYKKEYPFLKHVRCKDTKEYICDGHIWFDSDELVAMVGSCEYTDDKTKWIVSLEITENYKGYGLSKQILDYATKTMNCKYLSVNKNNAIAKKVYDNYGFKVYQESDTMYYMTIDKNVKESYAEEAKNDKGEDVPKVCPKCGSKIGVFLKGEPVYLCTNKECNKYFGTVPFTKKESCIDFLDIEII